MTAKKANMCEALGLLSGEYDMLSIDLRPPSRHGFGPYTCPPTLERVYVESNGLTLVDGIVDLWPMEDIASIFGRDAAFFLKRRLFPFAGGAPDILCMAEDGSIVVMPYDRPEDWGEVIASSLSDFLATLLGFVAKVEDPAEVTDLVGPYLVTGTVLEP